VLDISTPFGNDRDTELLLAIILDDIEIRQFYICFGSDGFGRGWMFASKADRHHGKSW